MEASYQPRKRPVSDMKPPPLPNLTHARHRIRSTGTSADVGYGKRPDPNNASEQRKALAEFRFFDEDRCGESTRESLSGETQPHHLNVSNLCNYDEPSTDLAMLVNMYTATDALGFPPPPGLPRYNDVSRLKLEEPLHPSGSLVLKREVIPVLECEDVDIVPHEQSPENNRAATVEHLLANRTETSRGNMSRSEAGVFDDRPNGSGEAYRVQRNSTNQYSAHIGEAFGSAQGFSIRRKSLPASTEPLMSPLNTLEATQKWLNSLADQENKGSRDDPAVLSGKLPRGPISVEKGVISRPHEAPSRKTPKSEAPKSLRHRRSSEVSQSSSSVQDDVVRPATQGPSTRPASPPLHRNTAGTRKPLDKKNRENWTLYNISCWTEAAHLKTLLKGPVLEFRIETHGEPFLRNVSRKMLEHFCGEKHLARLIRDHGLIPEQAGEEDGDPNVLVFPETTVDASAIMRIIRYMRRCCMRTTTLTKPHFQLRAPPSIQANVETIRACNIFGLYADAHRLQYFLTDKKIPGGKLTMEDVETIWEGYGGGLRDSAYTDALLTHLIYNVLGSDSVDREDIMVLLKEEKFAGLRELLATELGIKKRAAEDSEMFQMRKQLEREKIAGEADGKLKRLSKLDKIRAVRGPMVQGRLLRVLSYDALLEPDLTAETRYKAKVGLRGRAVSTPNLLDEADKQEKTITGSLYQEALRDIKQGRTSAGRDSLTSEVLSDLEKENQPQHTISHRKPAAPETFGRSHEQHRRQESHIQRPEDIGPPVPPKDHTPVKTRTTGTGNPTTATLSTRIPTILTPMKDPTQKPQPAPPTRRTPQHFQSQIAARGRGRVRAPTRTVHNAGKRRLITSTANTGSALQPTANPPILLQRTDPWWTTLGASQAPKLKGKKSPHKLKQAWDELRNFF